MPHHKSSKEVEGDPDTGHGRGMPLSPDDDELAQRTEADRLEIGLPLEPDEQRSPGEDRDP